MPRFIELPDVQIFHGDGSAASVRVYARLVADHAPSDVSLVGTLQGPYSRYAHTMAAQYQLTGLGSDPWPLAAVTIPEACPWTPEAPYVYQARIEVRRGDQLLEIVKRPWGWRPLAVRSRQLVWEGRPWVVRGWRLPQFPTNDPERAPHDFKPWRETATVYCGPADNGVCELATTEGTVVVAEILDDASCATAEVKRLAQWSAVAMIVLPASAPPIYTLRRVAPNTLLAVRRDIRSEPEHVEADVVVCQIPGDLPHEELLRSLAKWQERSTAPLMALRSGDRWTNVPAARAACDRLQRDLAGHGQFVGYLV